MENESTEPRRTYFAVRFRLRGHMSYLVWHSSPLDDNGGDEVMLAGPGRVRIFKNFADLQLQLAGDGKTVEVEPVMTYELDTLRRWLRTPSSETVDCKLFLNCWNLFSDILTSVAAPPNSNILLHIDGRRELRIYDKLFWGNNLRPVTPKGRKYVP